MNKVIGLARCAHGLLEGRSECPGGCGSLDFASCSLWADRDGMELVALTYNGVDRPHIRHYAQLHGLTVTDQVVGKHHKYSMRRKLS
jgi:hypothetical protein